MDNYSLRKVGMAQHHMTKELVEAKSAMNVTRRTLNARMAVTHEWDKLQFITGIDSQQNKHGKGMYSATMPKMNFPVTTDMEFQSYGGFGELSYELNDHNKLVTGIRVDQIEVDAVQTAQQRKETLPSGFIRLENQHPHHDAKTYVGLGYVERMPDYWELFTPKSGNGHPNTFKNIDTEKTLQLDIGYQHEHGNFSSWASAYAGVINDYILTTYTSMTDAHTRNVDATIAGAEVGMGYQFTDALQADVSAMYAWGENTTDNTPLPQISPLEGRLNLRYVQDRYTLGALLRVVDGQSRISKDEGNIVGYDLKESSGFGVLSLNGSYNLNKSVDVSVGVDNVLDKTYTEHLNKMGASGTGLPTDQQFNNIGRNYWARISMKF